MRGLKNWGKIVFSAGVACLFTDAAFAMISSHKHLRGKVGVSARVVHPTEIVTERVRNGVLSIRVNDASAANISVSGAPASVTDGDINIDMAKASADVFVTIVY